jgi:hypothetical protein
MSRLLRPSLRYHFITGRRLLLFCSPALSAPAAPFSFFDDLFFHLKS